MLSCPGSLSNPVPLSQRGIPNNKGKEKGNLFRTRQPDKNMKLKPYQPGEEGEYEHATGTKTTNDILHVLESCFHRVGEGGGGREGGRGTE